MFYEGLYLYQKTGVNTARTLYNHTTNYICSCLHLRTFWLMRQYNQPVGNTWQIPWQTPWASGHAPPVLPHLVPWIRDCHTQSGLHSHGCRCLPSRWYWEVLSFRARFLLILEIILAATAFVSHSWYGCCMVCTTLLLCKMPSGRVISICSINLFSSTHFMSWSESASC